MDKNVIYTKVNNRDKLIQALPKEPLSNKSDNTLKANINISIIFVQTRSRVCCLFN